MARIETIEALRALYGLPKERTIRKELEALEPHSRRLLSLSPFCLIGTSDGKGNADVTPRGDAPGFAQPLDDRTLMIPDRPGNKRLDTLSNILADSAVGLLFLVPGIGETLRVNGHAEIRDDPDLLERGMAEGIRPLTVTLVHIQSVYIHCPKAIIRSKLWAEEVQINRAALPSLGQMLRDQTGLDLDGETDDALIERLNRTLW